MWRAVVVFLFRNQDQECGAYLLAPFLKQYQYPDLGGARKFYRNDARFAPHPYFESSYARISGWVGQ